MVAQSVVDAAVERWGMAVGNGDAVLTSAEWFLQNHFPGIHHASCYYLRPSPAAGWTMWWVVYLHNTELKDDPGARVFEGSAGDLGWAMCVALQAAADAGFHRPISPDPLEAA